MAKRAARRAKLHAIDSARVHNLIFDHTPANDRDQSYLRKVRQIGRASCRERV